MGKFAVALFSYELGEEMHEVVPHNATYVVSQVLLFNHCERFSSDEVAVWLEKHQEHAGIADVQASVSEAQFAEAIECIQRYIEAGDTYQVNYTYRLKFDAYGSLHALYSKLRERQPVPYGALIALPDGGAVVSLSPELFVRHEKGMLTARPMKGTAAATGDLEQDAMRSTALAADPKNRAENLMIVDLLRNDLGRVAVPGSVNVPHLFDVSRYSSVLQMTSTVCAHLSEQVTLSETFAALYPCGSITGAPKRRTMQIIREVETAPRGFYTGAIGWFDRSESPDNLEGSDNQHAIGDFCLSVPIRTLVLQAPGADGVRAGEMGVGAGIVHDSVAADEYAECLLKARFLTGLSHEFDLFETIFATRAEECRHLDLHLRRLRTSAAYFGFSYDEGEIRRILRRTCDELPAGAHRVRLALNQAGVCTVQSASITPLVAPVKVLLSPVPTVANDVFLRHKSTVRNCYDVAWREAEAQGGFDMLFCNEQGELTEGGRSNVFVQLNGRWYTPPLSSGVLPGVMRTVILSDPAWQASERRLTLDELHAAEKIIVCNALRGALPALVDWK